MDYCMHKGFGNERYYRNNRTNCYYFINCYSVLIDCLLSQILKDFNFIEFYVIYFLKIFT